MSDAEAKAAALVLLTDLVQPTIDPKLTTGDNGELSRILDRHRVGSTWVSGTPLPIGWLVVPVTPSGRWYRTVVPGQSGAIEPTWSSGAGVNGRITDGTAILEDAGEVGSIYDINAAAFDAWDMKAAKCSNRPSPNLSLTYQHCIEMRDRFEQPLIA